METTAAKQALRGALRIAAKGLDSTARVAAGLAITHRLKGWQAWREADWIAAFVGEKHEPSTDALIGAALEGGKEVWLPSARRGELLAFRRCWALTELRAGPLGPLEPDPVGEARYLSQLAGERSGLVLVPALALSSTGARIGRGGGYYDGVLSQLHTALRPAAHDDGAWEPMSFPDGNGPSGKVPRVFIVGVAMARMIDPVEGDVPEGPQDRRVDFVCDELGLRRCNPGALPGVHDRGR